MHVSFIHTDSASSSRFKRYTTQVIPTLYARVEGGSSSELIANRSCTNNELLSFRCIPICWISLLDVG